MNHKFPKVSVVMSVLNGEKTLSAAIESILRQSFQDFEFIVVNDGSSDQTSNILRDFAAKDQRIRIINSENRGLASALNLAIQNSTGEFVARQDADDVSEPHRLQKEALVLETSPDVSLLGSWYQMVSQGKIISSQCPQNLSEDLRLSLYKKNPFCHSSVMFRRAAFEAVGGYDPNLTTGQDLDLWFKLAGLGKLFMIEESLVKKGWSGKLPLFSQRAWLQIKDGFAIRWRHRNSLRFKCRRTLIAMTAVRHILNLIIPRVTILKTTFNQTAMFYYLIHPAYWRVSLRKFVLKIKKLFVKDMSSQENLSRFGISDWEADCKATDPDLWRETVEAMQALGNRAEIMFQDKRLPKLGGGGNYYLLYFLTRFYKPRTVVETGVAAGFSTAAILMALEANGAGHLYSNDLPYFRYWKGERYIGLLVPDNLRRRWTLNIQDDREGLTKILAASEEVDLFHYDSEKSFGGREFAWGKVRGSLSPTGVAIFDDIQTDPFFRRVLSNFSGSYKIYGFGGKYLGVLTPGERARHRSQDSLQLTSSDNPLI